MADQAQTPATQAASSDAAPAAAAGSTEAVAAKSEAFTGKTAETPATENKEAAAPAKEGEAKTADDKAAADAKEAKDAEAAKAAKAPEKYEDFKLPKDTKLDTEMLTEFGGIAKTLNLTQEAAQKVVDLAPKLLDKWTKAQTDGIKATHTQWAADLKNDAEIGGDKLAENLSVAQRGLNAYDKSGKLNQLLKDTGLSNHVELVRVFHEIGKTLKQDEVVNPDGGNTNAMPTGPGSLEAIAKAIYAKN